MQMTQIFLEGKSPTLSNWLWSLLESTFLILLLWLYFTVSWVLCYHTLWQHRNLFIWL